MVKFNDRMVTDVVQTFWAAMQRGEFITDAAAEVGTYRAKGRGWLRASGGVRPRQGRGLVGRCLPLGTKGLGLAGSFSEVWHAEVEVEPILHGLALGYLLEGEPSPSRWIHVMPRLISRARHPAQHR
jgi:hypothetical protein